MVIWVEMAHYICSLLITVERDRKGEAGGRKLAGHCARQVYAGALAFLNIL